MLDPREEHKAIMKAESSPDTAAIAMYRELAEHNRKQGRRGSVVVIEDLCDRLEKAIGRILAQHGKIKRAELALKLAYLKHHCGDESVGWDELGDALCNGLCEVMGDDLFQAWSKEANKPC